MHGVDALLQINECNVTFYTYSSEELRNHVFLSIPVWYYIKLELIVQFNTRSLQSKVCTISFDRPVNYLCDAWHVFPPKYEAWTYFNSRPDSFVMMLRYCSNLKAIRYESVSLNRIAADKSYRVIVA